MENDHLVTAIIAVLTAIIGVAIIAVIVSRKSATAQVLQSGGNAFANILKAALGPTQQGFGITTPGVTFGF